MEIDHGVFERELFLTTPVNQEEVSATYKQGILRISLPKVREIPGE
jgi:HSP20 family molecular chaperone IbpA